MSLKYKFFSFIPYFLQNCIISFLNNKNYTMRHGGRYNEFREYYKRADLLNEHDLKLAINEKKDNFLNYSINKSKWYSAYENINFSDIPPLNKVDLINNLNDIKTIDEKKGIVSLTGGTTGASMKVIYTQEDMQERFAILDHFRAKHGYNLGKKTAWFSGKNLITKSDLRKGHCSHYDFINKIRFYSTFLINVENFDIYWQDLNKFKPEFIVGFPSSVYELCKIAKSRGLKLEKSVKVFFPTAETVLQEHRTVISEIMGCKLVDQYASSEGAPFILECDQGKLHLHPLTGIFEVVDSELKPSRKGELLVTSFTTHGTPLIRYRIGDSVELGSGMEFCACGSKFPVVESIQGRTTDYIYSEEYGKVNLGNLSNSTKDVEGIICFQILQDNYDSLDLFIVKNNKFSKLEENKFISSLRERVGEKIGINITYVDNIAKEKSGKFRIVKNNLKIEG